MRGRSKRSYNTLINVHLIREIGHHTDNEQFHEDIEIFNL